MWEGLPAFGINITLTSIHMDGMWFTARHPWKMAASQERDVFGACCSWAGKNRSGPRDLKGQVRV